MPLVLLSFLTAMLAVLPAADIIPGAATPAPVALPARPHNRLVVVLVDGLGARKAFEPGTMPGLQARLASTAHGIAVASFPTITPPGLRAVFSGHRSLPEPEVPGGLRPGLEADSVIKRASAAGLEVVAVGQSNWQPLFHGHGGLIKTISYRGESIVFAHERRRVLSSYDARVLAAARPWIEGRRGHWDLLILHLFEADPIGHALGTEDTAYDAHLRWVDARLTELTSKLTAQQPTTFLFLADHGMTRAGTHGGMTPAEREVPFVLWGAGVRPGRLAARRLYDAAPTISAILGVEPPAGAEGLPAVEALDLPPRQLAAVWADVLAQRSGRWKAVSALLPWLRGDPASMLGRVESLRRAGRFDEAARLLERSVREADRRLDDALPEKWFTRLLVSTWCLVLAACFSLAWPGGQRARAAAGPATLAILAAVSAPLWRPSLWGWSSALAEGAAAALLVMALSAGLRRDSGLSAAGWAAWCAAAAGLSWQELLDVNLWAAAVLVTWLCWRAWTRRSASVAFAAIALALSALVRERRGENGLSIARSELPRLGAFVLGPGQARLLAAATVMVLLWLLRRELSGVSRGQTALELTAAAATPCVALFLPGGGVHAGWAVGAALASAAAALAWGGRQTRGRCLSLAAAGFFGSLATPTQACALLLSVVVGFAAADDDAHPLLAGLTLVALSLWSFTISGGRLRYLAVSVEEGHRAFGTLWFPRALVGLLLLKFVAGASAAILPGLGLRTKGQALAVVPPLGVLGAGFMTTLWWDRFMQGGNLKFTGQLAYVGLVSTVIVGWVIVALWVLALARAALPTLGASPPAAGVGAESA